MNKSRLSGAYGKELRARKTFKLSQPEERGSISSPEYSEKLNYYTAKNSSCSCCMGEVNKVKRYKGDVDQSDDSYFEDMKQDALRLTLATRFPFSVCEWVIECVNSDEEIAAKWLTKEAVKHGYRHEGAPAMKGMVCISWGTKNVVMVELRIECRTQKRVSKVIKDQNVQNILGEVAKALTLSKSPPGRIDLNEKQILAVQYEEQRVQKSLNGLFIKFPNHKATFSLNRAIVWQAANETELIGSLVVDKIADSTNFKIGYTGALVAYQGKNGQEVPAYVGACLCEHVARCNPLTLGAVKEPLDGRGFTEIVIGGPSKSYEDGESTNSTLNNNQKDNKKVLNEKNSKKTGAEKLKENENNNGGIAVSFSSDKKGDLNEKRHKKSLKDKTTKKMQENSNNTKTTMSFASINEAISVMQHHPYGNDEVRLLHQRLHSDPSMTVGQAIEANHVEILDFIRYECVVINSNDVMRDSDGFIDEAHSTSQGNTESNIRQTLQLPTIGRQPSASFRVPSGRMLSNTQMAKFSKSRH